MVHHHHPATAMLDTDNTLSSPITAVRREAPALLCLSILSHPDPAMIGAQFLAGSGAASIELARYQPLFRHPGKDGLPLGHRAISRAPLQLHPTGAGGFAIGLPDSRMKVELNGAAVLDGAELGRDEMAAGAILGLGGVVVLCLHWMRCLPRSNPVDGLIGIGEAAIRTRDQILQVSPTGLTVLLLGETGSGKDVAARAIHARSPQAGKPMVTVNLAALSESLATAELFGAARGAYTGAHAARPGLFAQAQNSTLFLDEIGSAPASVQPMLLRVLETGEYRPLGASVDQHANARVIAATDQDLYGGVFSQALLRRLESHVIHIAPLRQRREDLGVLIQHLLAYLGDRIALPAALIGQLACYDWPGNVRQLKHLLTRCVLSLEAGETIDFDALVGRRDTTMPTVAGPVRERRARLGDLTDATVQAALQAHKGNIQATARALGISRPSMYKLIKAHGAGRPADDDALT
jgi:transcriptional regulator with AAA-type ATPase domain